MHFLESWKGAVSSLWWEGWLVLVRGVPFDLRTEVQGRVRHCWSVTGLLGPQGLADCRSHVASGGSDRAQHDTDYAGSRI